MIKENIFRIDREWYTSDDLFLVSLKETGDILTGKNTGRLQIGPMYIETIGTYYNYELVLHRRKSFPLERWDALFKVLTDPKSVHSISMLHDQGFLEFDAYISTVSRSIERKKKKTGETYWGDYSVKFTAMDKIDASYWN